jgi:hypothetical protein
LARGPFGGFRIQYFLAAMVLPLCAAAENAPELYRVDQAGIGSCYDADLSLMLSGHVFAYLEPGAVEVSFPRPPQGIKAQERVVLLGDRINPFPARASRYILTEVLGKDVLLAFDSTMRNASGALRAYLYLPEDGTCVNFRLVRDGLTAVASADEVFQFRAEFELYEQQAKEKRRGVWGR